MRPLITFALVAYNQEDYIREAVRSAFSQTYSPLEIILSDDCSLDKTFEIIAGEAKGYQGPHRIVVNRTPKNTGLSGHYNEVFRKAKGELVICAAGDDISLPSRAQALYEAWEQTGREAMGLHSGAVLVDHTGRTLDFDEYGLPNRYVKDTCSAGCRIQLQESRITPLQYATHLVPIANGCSCCWSPRLFRVFGPFPEGINYEDVILTFRALLVGKLVRLDTALVKWRMHGSNLSLGHYVPPRDMSQASEEERRNGAKYRNFRGAYESFIRDAGRAVELGLIRPNQAQALTAAIMKRKTYYEVMDSITRSSPLKKLALLRSLKSSTISPSEMRTAFLHLLPRSLRLSLRVLRVRIRGSYRNTGCC